MLHCCLGENKPISQALAQELVRITDEITVPVDKSILIEQSPESIEGENILKLSINKNRFPNFMRDNEDIAASLVGPPSNPKAVIYWIQSNVAYYYVPFKGINTVDRRRRLSKIGDRVFKVESNRSTTGEVVDSILP